MNKTLTPPGVPRRFRSSCDMIQSIKKHATCVFLYMWIEGRKTPSKTNVHNFYIYDYLILGLIFMGIFHPSNRRIGPYKQTRIACILKDYDIPQDEKNQRGPPGIVLL